MNKQTFIEIVIAIVMVFVLIVIVARKIFEKKINKAIMIGDEALYRKYILNPITPYLLNSHRSRLLRALCYSDLGEALNAAKEMKHVNVDFLKAKEKVMYINCATSTAVALKDRQMFNGIESLIEHVTEGADHKVIDSLMKEYKLNKRLYFDFDPDVIRTLKERIKDLDGVEKGNMQVNLAKAYHFNHEDDLAIETLKQAKENLKNTTFSIVIDQMINDLTLLDQ